MLGAAAFVLAWALADVQADDKAMASELLAEGDAPARDRWLEAHRAQLTTGLGRAVAAQARAHLIAGRFDLAREAFAAALRLGEIGGDPTSRILGLEGLGAVERQRGHARESLPILERAMEEAEAAKDQRAVGRLMGSIGTARRMLGEYSEALALHERQLAVFDTLGDAEWRGWSHNNLGIVLGSLGRYVEAIPHFEQSRELFEAAGRSEAVATAYNNLGNCLRDIGDYAAALRALSRSLEMQQAAGNRAGMGATLNSIGEVYGVQGAPARALDYFRRGYAIATELEQRDLMVNNLGDEGISLIDLGRLQEGRVALEKAVAVAEDLHNPMDITWLSAYLAQVHRDLGDRRRALDLLRKGLETAERTQQALYVASAQRQIADLRLEENEAKEALELAGQAAQTARRYELREELWPALVVVGRAERALAHPDRAEAALREAVEVVEELRAHAVGPDADRAAFLVPHAAPYQELVSLLADAGRPWDALAVAERSKGRVLLDVLAGRRGDIGAALTEAEKAEERRLEADLRSSNSELRTLLQQPTPDAARQKLLESQRNERRLALEDWSTRQEAAHPELRVLRGESPPLTSDDLKDLLADGRTVLLEYVLCGRQAYLFALGAGAGDAPSLSVRRLDVESAELVRLARDLRERLAARDMEFGEPAAALHQALLSPARDALKSARRLVLVPDGALWELPFQALRSPAGRFLIEDVSVSYVPSLSVLRDMRAHRRARNRPEGALLALSASTETQVRGIARLYDPRTTAVRVGKDARESWLKAEAPRYRLLHLATHGVLDDASPLYSQLVLSPPAKDEHDDGLLEAREILDLDLGAELTVLSACETGRGRPGAGEGLIGMTWAFFAAGCPTTVASQWKVEAQSTDRLMLAFHHELLAGHVPADALRLASLAQLKRQDQRHPFYWAGFVAMGDAVTSPAFVAPWSRNP